NSPATKEAIEPPAPLRPFLTNSLISWNGTMNNFNWVGQGYPNNGDGASDSTNASSFQEITFSVSKGTSITDVRDLLQLFNFPNGQESTYFLVNSCVWNGSDCVRTGLIGATQIAEPWSLLLLVTGLLVFGLFRL